jgi:hypothetical protein
VRCNQEIIHSHRDETV